MHAQLCILKIHTHTLIFTRIYKYIHILFINLTKKNNINNLSFLSILETQP